MAVDHGHCCAFSDCIVPSYRAQSLCCAIEQQNQLFLYYYMLVPMARPHSLPPTPASTDYLSLFYED